MKEHKQITYQLLDTAMGSCQLPLKSTNATNWMETNAHRHVGVTIEERAVKDGQLSKHGVKPSPPHRLSLCRTI